MIFLRVVAILALLPGLAAGEEGLVVSAGDATPPAQVTQQPADNPADLPGDAELRPANGEAAEADNASVASDPPTEPPKPKVDWSTVSNPVAPSSASTDRGEALYKGKGLCQMCHGEKGDGFGAVRGQFNPFPNGFFEAEWHDRFSDGELMGILTEGKLGTSMIPLVPDFVTEKQGWDIINYLRTLKGRTSADHERYLSETAQQEKIKQEAIATERF